MNKSQLSSYGVIFLALAFSFSLSCMSLSSIHYEPDPQGFISCLESFPNDTNITELTFSPANASFLPIWQFSVNNLRFNKSSIPKPCFIVTPVDDTQVQAALYCTKTNGYEIRIRGGGHDMEGLSHTANVPFVMIDLINMRSIDVDVANEAAWVQGGATLGDLYYAISQKTNTLYFPGGVGPTVGVGGFLGGGGSGNLLRKYGTGADNVVDVRFMDVNGNILDKNSMGEDFFWAIRGGGASSFGIVLAWKLRLVPVPEIVTVFQLNKTLEEGATDIFYKYQYVAPTIDRNLLLRVEIFSQFIGNTTKKTIRMLFEAVYLGTIDTLLPLMEDSLPELGVTREICEEMSMVQTTLVFGGFPSSTPPEILTNRSAHSKLDHKGKTDYVREPIPIVGLKKIWRKIFENDGSEILIFYPFGGRIAEYSETAIPYSHRAGVLYQIEKAVNFYDQTSDTTPIALRRWRWLRSLHKFITPYVSKNPREAYFNYNDLELGVGSANYKEASTWGEAYWKRDNFKKLIRIKAEVDPENFFRHPQSIPVFSKSASSK